MLIILEYVVGFYAVVAFHLALIYIFRKPICRWIGKIDAEYEAKVMESGVSREARRIYDST